MQLGICKKHGETNFNAYGKCRACAYEATQKWREKNKEAVKQYSIDYAAKHRDELIAKRAADYKNRKEEYAAARKAQYAKHSEKRRDERISYYYKNKVASSEYARKRREQFPEKISETNQKWRAINRDRIKASKAKWDRENPTRRRYHSSLRRARLRMATIGNMPKNIIEILFNEQKGNCACCGVPLVKYHLDHIHPLSKGGAHSKENVQLLTPRCNQRKYNKTSVSAKKGA